MFPGLVDCERRRQVAVGVDLGEQLICLLLDRRDRIGARDPAQRRVVVDEGDESVRELRGSPPCLPLIASHAGRVWAVRSA